MELQEPMNPLDMHFSGMKFHGLHQILKGVTKKVASHYLARSYISKEEEKQHHKQRNKQRNGEGRNKPVKRKMSDTRQVVVVVTCPSKAVSEDGAGKTS